MQSGMIASSNILFSFFAKQHVKSCASFMQTGNYLDSFVFVSDNMFPFEMLQIMCSAHIDSSFTSGNNYIDKLAHIRY